ncbi:alcohol dehydrogenase [Ornatilinea apprima]|uniref:Alcohol dehydrogenase n=1 Tax=Ornatilinea apprima TaxID=1134406 RepID=A0A0P6XU97_9CHLR|nr:alcohol dehydrogenase catalytic domain-containing protein [Ornatilinea apprima]KPL78711.1 alcohol dehydrogenase [Ornatilinea apprima]
MGEKFQAYRSLDYSLPDKTLAWNLYGAGLENMGCDGQPEAFDVPEPNDDQMLVRIDSVGVCFSDIKVLKQGSAHPKLYNRDMRQEPTRLGHEVSLTVVKVGKNLAGNYHPGQRLAVQPDIYQQGKSTAYGYTIPGGLVQYHLIGKEVLETDAGACLLPMADSMGYAESSLLEPWGCVMAAYTQRRRLTPKAGGVMWMVGQPGDETVYTCSLALSPSRIVLSNVPASMRKIAEASGAEIIERDGLTPADFDALKQDVTDGLGFDDIVVLNPGSADVVGKIARLIARRGTCNLVGAKALDGLVEVDLGRLHYDYIAFVGTSGTDIAAAYGEARNRCELRPGGTTVFVGAGGPMGQMHVQRALELPTGPKLVIVTEISDERLQTLRDMFQPLAEKYQRTILYFNPNASQQSFHAFVMESTQGQGADDVVVSVPVAALMEEGGAVMKPDGMLVLFAGVPNGTMGKVDMSNVYLSNAQYTGTSGLTIDDQSLVMERRVAGTLSPGRSVAAIGGLETAPEAIRSVMEGRYPGKVVVFPQLSNLPLMALKELPEKLPEVAAKLGENLMWTNEAEEVLIEKYWEKPE